MKILGIDYGRKKIGLALATGLLAEPWKVIKVTSIDDAVKKVKSACAEASADEVVVGISEGEMGEESKKFALAISHQSLAIVETFDETLSTHTAQELSREAGMSRDKRKDLEDAYAASVMLQSYLDTYV
jgi:putative Holliday junction resolvase